MVQNIFLADLYGVFLYKEFFLENYFLEFILVDLEILKFKIFPIITINYQLNNSDQKINNVFKKICNFSHKIQ